MSVHLSRSQIESFRNDGYLIVTNVFSAEELGALEQEYEHLLDEVAAELHADGSVADAYQGLPFTERYIRLLQAYPDLHKLLDIALPSTTKMTAKTRVHTGPAVFHLLTHPRLLSMVEGLVGPEVGVSPIQHIRIKPPAQLVPEQESYNTNVATTTWHQDGAVVSEDADETQMVTAWTAVTESSEKDGCLVCVPGSHRRERGLTPHIQDSNWSGETYIPEHLVDKDAVKVLPVPRGSVIFFDRHLEHASLPNRSEVVRISLDFRYHPAGQPSGRSIFPGFTARSTRSPDSVVKGCEEWTRLWLDARDRVVRGESDFEFNSRWPTVELDS